MRQASPDITTADPNPLKEGFGLSNTPSASPRVTLTRQYWPPWGGQYRSDKDFYTTRYLTKARNMVFDPLIGADIDLRAI